MGIHKNRAETTHFVKLGAAVKRGLFGRIEVSFRRGPAEVAPYLDDSLQPVTHYTEAHIYFQIWSRRDLELDQHRSDAKFRAQFPAKAAVLDKFDALAARLADVGGGTVSGTKAQRECLARHEAELAAARYPRTHYDAACDILKREGLYEVGEWRGPSGEGAPRPYRYGSAWLLAGVPADLEAEILAAVAEFGA